MADNFSQCWQFSTRNTLPTDEVYYDLDAVEDHTEVLQSINFPILDEFFKDQGQSVDEAK